MKNNTFNSKMVALALVVATATGIALFPTLQKELMLLQLLQRDR